MNAALRRLRLRRRVILGLISVLEALGLLGTMLLILYVVPQLGAIFKP